MSAGGRVAPAGAIGRRAWPRRWMHVPSACFIVLFALGCGARERRHEAHAPDTASRQAEPPAFVNPAEVPQPPPPQPAGPPIAKTDSLMNSIAPDLQEWVLMWRTALRGFEVDSMWGTRPQRWSALSMSALDGDTEHKDTDADVAFQIFGLPSPDRRYILDVDSYQSVEPDADTLVVGGEPDSRCMLIDQKAKSEAILQFCGTACGFHWGRW